MEQNNPQRMLGQWQNFSTKHYRKQPTRQRNRIFVPQMR